MAYYNNSGKNQRSGENSNFSRKTTVKKIVNPITLENYVDIAEENIKSLVTYGRNGNKLISISTSKIRYIFSMVANVYNKEVLNNSNDMLESTKAGLQTLRVKLVYEAGRYPNETGTFIDKCNILEYLKNINNDKKEFLLFFHYFEALVAYHRFFGGNK